MRNSQKYFDLGLFVILWKYQQTPSYSEQEISANIQFSKSNSLLNWSQKSGFQLKKTWLTIGYLYAQKMAIPCLALNTANIVK